MARVGPDDSPLANTKARKRLDLLLAHRLRQHGLPSDVGVLHSTEDLFNDLKAAWDAQRWFLVSSVCGLLAEFLFGSLEGGGTLGPVSPHQQDVAGLREFFRRLHNSCFHPAHINVDAGSGPLHYILLADQLESLGLPDIAAALRQTPRSLRSRELAEASLRRINDLVKLLLIR